MCCCAPVDAGAIYQYLISSEYLKPRWLERLGGSSRPMLNATVLDRIEVTPELFILRVKPDAGVPEFHSGQYVALGLPGSAPRPAHLPPDREPLDPEKLIKRAYSIGSSPLERDYLEFYIAVVPEGQLTPRLSMPQPGTRVYVAPKITGTFTLHGVQDDHNLVLLATGTGLAPFVSMVRTPQVWTPNRRITIVHGVRYAKDLGYREELSLLSQSNPALTYIPIVSRADPEWSGRTGRVQRLFEDGTIPLNPERDHLYLCGNPAMIEEMEGMLLGRGYSVHSKKNPTGKLHLEKYW